MKGQKSLKQRHGDVPFYDKQWKCGKKSTKNTDCDNATSRIPLSNGGRGLDFDSVASHS